MNEWGFGGGFDALPPTEGGEQFDIELVGPHLRVGGRISLGRFSRLSDRVNHGNGYLRISDARLLKRNGEPTSLVVPELWVNPDEVTFLAITRTPDVTPVPGALRSPEYIAKQIRRFLVFTPGHVITGLVHVFPGMSVAGIVEGQDPRFLPLTNVSARSLADRRVISRFDLLLVNRTQMTAASITDEPLTSASGEPGGVEVEAPIVES